MFRFPDISIDDAARVADWVELCALFGKGGTVSRRDVEDVVFDRGLLGVTDRKASLRIPEYEDIDCLTAEDSLSRMSELVWRGLQERRRVLGDAYPFAVSTRELTRADDVKSWQARPAQAALLLADLSKDYSKAKLPKASRFRRLFETIVQSSFRSLFRGASIRFGVPADPDWPKGITKIADRLEELGDRLSLAVNPCEEDIECTDQDLGLDVLARLSFGDENPGTLYILAQCATGVEWRKEKKGEPSLELWSRLLSWDAIRVRAIAVPYRVSDSKDLRRTAAFFDAIVVDRLRLFAGRPDEGLPSWCRDQLVNWVSEQLERIPPLA